MAFDMEWQQIISINTFKGTFYTVLASRVDSKWSYAAYLLFKATDINLRLWRFVVMISKCNVTIYITTARARPWCDDTAINI